MTGEFNLIYLFIIFIVTIILLVPREARGERGVFHLVPQLNSPERERNFLRLVAELLVARCLPPEYSRCTPLRNLLKELLACKGVFCYGSVISVRLCWFEMFFV